MGVWDTSVGVSVGSGVVAIPPKLRMLWWSWSWTKQHFPLPQTASLLLQKWMVGKRDSFPFWSPKSQFCRGEVGAVCFGETYDVIDLDVWTLYFWDPYLFFFLPKPISGLNWWGAYNERCENSLCFFIGWYLFFWNLRQTGWDLVGEFLKFEGLNATLPPVVFSKGKQNIMSSTNGTGLMLGKSSYLFHKSIFSYKYQT